MNFELSDEQRMLQETLSRLLREQYPFETRQKLLQSPQGFSRELWHRYAELGILGVPFSDEVGGFGGGGIELMLVAKALGRALTLEPYLATVVLGGTVLATVDSQRARSLLEEVIAGQMLLAFAHWEPGERYNGAIISTHAQARDGGHVLSGHKAVVLHGQDADRLIVSAMTREGVATEGIALFLVDPRSPGVTVRGYTTIDGLRAAEIQLESAPAGLLAAPEQAAQAIDRAIGYGLVALCAEAVGAMEVICELTLEYLKTRQQFGVPIGKFQALQHRMVDMVIRLEQSRSITLLAAAHVDDTGVDRDRALSAAKALIGKSGRFVAESAIQLHGGIGMTWEYSMPHYAKRVVMIDHVLGDVDFHLDRFSSLMEVSAA